MTPRFHGEIYGAMGGQDHVGAYLASWGILARICGILTAELAGTRLFPSAQLIGLR